MRGLEATTLPVVHAVSLTTDKTLSIKQKRCFTVLPHLEGVSSVRFSIGLELDCLPRPSFRRGALCVSNIFIPDVIGEASIIKIKVNISTEEGRLGHASRTTP